MLPLNYTHMDTLVQQLQTELNYAGEPLSSDELQSRLDATRTEIADAARVLRYQNNAVFTTGKFKAKN